MELNVGKEYRCVRKIASGSFGDVYLGINITTGEEVAIKLEPVNTTCRQLHYEATVYGIIRGGCKFDSF